MQDALMEGLEMEGVGNVSRKWYQALTNVYRYATLSARMKRRQYTKQQGIRYRTARRWFRAGAITGYHELSRAITRPLAHWPTGTMIVTEGGRRDAASDGPGERRHLCARLLCRAQRACGAAGGASHAGRRRAWLPGGTGGQGARLRRQREPSPAAVAPHGPAGDTPCDRAARSPHALWLALPHLQTLLQAQGRQGAGVTLAENDTEGLVADLVAMVSSFTARRAGQRWATRKTERSAAEVRREVDSDAAG